MAGRAWESKGPRSGVSLFTERRYIGPGSLSDNRLEMRRQLFECRFFLRSISVGVIGADELRRNMIENSFGNMRLHAKLAQADPHSAAQIVNSPWFQLQCGVELFLGFRPA